MQLFRQLSYKILQLKAIGCLLHLKDNLNLHFKGLILPSQTLLLFVEILFQKINSIFVLQYNIFVVSTWLGEFMNRCLCSSILSKPFRLTQKQIDLFKLR
jgi:hypothetical protein